MTFSPRHPAATAALVCLVAGAVAAQKPPDPQQPVFKSGVEIVQLDVSVLDKHRQPVRGLTAADFTILEDGKPRTIVGFSAFDIDRDSAPATGWMRDVPPDVATNESKESRLFVIVMDDAMIPQEPYSIQSSKKIAASIIEKLGPDDLTAVVFTGDNRKTQDFTSDKTKLLAALDKFNPGLTSYRFGATSEGVDVDFWFYQSAVRTLANLADFLGDVPNRRKAVFWVSPGVPVDMVIKPPPADPRLQIWEKADEAFRRAQRANVTFYPIDPTGLGGLEPFANSLPKPADRETIATKVRAMNDFIVATAANTGGRTVMNTNDFEPGIKAVFEENESYYLLGFEPANSAADGKLHRLEVKVNRPDVEVRTRRGYYAPEPPKPSKNKQAMSPETEALGKAIAGLLPSVGLPMRVATAPFAVPGNRLAAVTVVLGVQQPVPPAAADGRVTETTELQISAFTPEGVARGTQRHTAKVVLRAGADGDARYEVLGRIDLSPGRYRLRLAATNSTSLKTGSVFADVVVPDYSNVAFSATPVVLSATPGRASAPKDLLASLLPVVPTAEREFSPSDQVTALMRLYQSGQKPIDKVALTIRIRDAADLVVVDETRSIGADQFPAVGQELASSILGPTLPGQYQVQAKSGDRFANLSLRMADTRFPIPLTKLAPGPHLLTLEASLGTTTIRRDVRFSVK